MSSDASINYQKDHISDDRRPLLLGVFVFCLIISYVAVLLRFVSRRLNKNSLKTDDWMAFASLFPATALIGLNLRLVADGFGRHEILVEDKSFFVQGVTISEILYSLTIWSVKVSTLFLLRRIFPGHYFVRMLWVIGAVITTYTLIQTICVLTQCVPLKSLWDQTITGKCIPLRIVFAVGGGINAATDIAILTLPMPKLWKLNVSLKRKIQLTLIFALGSFVCIISILRIPQMLGLSPVDPRNDVGSGSWSILECAMATLSACLPTLRPIFDCVFSHGRFRSSVTDDSRTRQSKGNGKPGSTKLGSHLTHRQCPHPNISTNYSAWATRDTLPFARSQRDYIDLEEMGGTRPASRQRVRGERITVTTDIELRSHSHTPPEATT